RGPRAQQTLEMPAEVSPVRAGGRSKVWMFAAAAAIVVLAIAVFAGRQWIWGPSSSGPIDSIAVLPFTNQSGNADADYLADGIPGTLINDLTQVAGLRVIPLTLTAQYAGKTIDPRKVATELNARALVTGRITQRGDRLVIQAELTDAGKVAQLWGEKFDR